MKKPSERGVRAEEDSAAVAPESTARGHVVTCQFCHRPYVIEEENGYEYFCTRCGKPFPNSREIERKIAVSHKFAVLGFGLLFPAFFLPMLTIEQFGARTEAGFLLGVYKLWVHGDYLLAVIIGLFSGLFPALKLAGMIVLTSHWFSTMRVNRRIYALVSATGKWGMLDVFLTAIVLFGFKFSEIFRIQVKSGVIAFAAMVLCNLIAWAYFDTRLYKEDQL